MTDDLLTLWDNLPSLNKGMSIAGLVAYLATVFAGVAFYGIFPWYIDIACFIWPVIIGMWVIGIWIFGALFMAVRIVGHPEIQARKVISGKVQKALILAPTVIGTMLSVVDVFAKDIFSGDGEGKE